MGKKCTWGGIFKTMGKAGKPPNLRRQWIITSIYNKICIYELNNYRHITITNNAYKTWAADVTSKLKQYMNFLTNQVQNACKTGRSPIDLLYIF